MDIFLIDDKRIDCCRIASRKNLMIGLYGYQQRPVVSGYQLRVALEIAIIVDHAAMILKFHCLPSVYGICVDSIVHPDVLYDTPLVIIGDITHLAGQRVNTWECVTESPIPDESVISIIPREIVGGLPSRSASLRQYLITYQL